MSDTTFWLVLSLLLNGYLLHRWLCSARDLWNLEVLRRRFVIFLSASKN